MPIIAELEQMKSEMVRTLHGWWISARRANGLPCRDDFDPAQCKALLPNLVVSDVEQDPFRVRYRLVGTRVVAFTGYEFTGRYADEFRPAEVADYWQGCYRASHATQRPVFGSVTEPTRSGGEFTFEFGIFPLSLSGDGVEQFICVEDYFGVSLISAQLQPWET